MQFSCVLKGFYIVCGAIGIIDTFQMKTWSKLLQKYTFLRPNVFCTVFYRACWAICTTRNIPIIKNIKVLHLNMTKMFLVQWFYDNFNNDTEILLICSEYKLNELNWKHTTRSCRSPYFKRFLFPRHAVVSLCAKFKLK